jgi:hypothetical protein
MIRVHAFFSSVYTNHVTCKYVCIIRVVKVRVENFPVGFCPLEFQTLILCPVSTNYGNCWLNYLKKLFYCAKMSKLQSRYCINFL